jgi:hypothetical protein
MNVVVSRGLVMVIVAVLIAFNVLGFRMLSRDAGALGSLGFCAQVQSSVPGILRVSFDSGQGFNRDEAWELELQGEDAPAQDLWVPWPGEGVLGFRLEPLDRPGSVVLSQIGLGWRGERDPADRIEVSQWVMGPGIVSFEQNADALTLNTRFRDAYLLLQEPEGQIAKALERKNSQQSRWVWTLWLGNGCLLLALVSVVLRRRTSSAVRGRG